MLHKGRYLFSQAGMSLGLVLFVWLLLGLLDATETYLKLSQSRSEFAWYGPIGQGLTLWLIWAILALPIAVLVRFCPFDLRHWPTSVVIYLIAATVGAVVKMMLDYPVISFWAVYGPPDKAHFLGFMQSALTGYLLRYLLIFWAIAGICHACDFYRQSRERARKAAQLEEGLTQAQLQLLQAQLHPHFLFNTLNAISTLIHRDAEVADRMLARLGDLLRLTLDNADTQDVPLGRELEFIRAYIEIEQVRFGPRLQVTIDVEPEALELPVPYLVLQPIVENAIKHGIAPTNRPGRIGITAQRVRDCLRLEVCDDGPGLPRKPLGKRIGIGLANVRARLDQLYGVDYRLELANRDSGGVRAVIYLPILVESDLSPDAPLLEPQFSDVP